MLPCYCKFPLATFKSLISSIHTTLFTELLNLHFQSLLLYCIVYPLELLDQNSIFDTLSIICTILFEGAMVTIQQIYIVDFKVWKHKQELSTRIRCQTKPFPFSESQNVRLQELQYPAPRPAPPNDDRKTRNSLTVNQNIWGKQNW